MSENRIVRKIQGGNEKIRVERKNEGIIEQHGNENNNTVKAIIKNVPPPPPPRHPNGKK